MTDENARCNAAMDGAGPAHSEPHDGAEFRPIERNPDPPAALLHAPVACNLWISSQDLNPVESGALMRTLIKINDYPGIIISQAENPRGTPSNIFRGGGGSSRIRSNR